MINITALATSKRNIADPIGMKSLVLLGIKHAQPYLSFPTYINNTDVCV